MASPKYHSIARVDQKGGEQRERDGVVSYVRRRSVRRARQGVTSGHGGDLYFFLLAALYFSEGGGKNKEESKILNST